ncbi:MAG: low temperature requirement protein A [Planctomycetes bacterium]|nr:low temperature requirement protein A [Planctomycetota bacterium]
MVPRDPSEGERPATTLELLFDLCFVVAIALAAQELHHSFIEAHIADGIFGFVMVFFAIWWAWMGFTWFASAFDNDDTPYRLAVLVQMVGVLVLAAGVPRASHGGDFTIITFGYVIMRVGLVALWVRAAKAGGKSAGTALKFAIGIVICQVGWISLLYLPLPEGAWVIGWGVMVLSELAVPVWATRPVALPFHPHHIAERYGLLTIIVVGESVLAATLAIQAALELDGISVALGCVIAGSPLIMFSMWWLYFLMPSPGLLTSTTRAFIWGYGHLPIFMSAAAVGASLAIAADHTSGHGHASDVAVGLALGVSVAVFLLSVWAVQIRPHRPTSILSGAFLVTALAVVLAAWTPWPTLAIGLLLALLVAPGVLVTHKGWFKQQTAAPEHGDHSEA